MNRCTTKCSIEEYNQRYHGPYSHYECDNDNDGTFSLNFDKAITMFTRSDLPLHWVL